jgi:hypothetical protein
MPVYFPENNTPYPDDSSLRSLQKINGALVSGQVTSGMEFDAFGRLKTGVPFTLFDSSHRYVQNTSQYTDTTNGSATVTYDTNQSCSLLNVTAASGDYVYRESRRVFPYQPGKGLECIQSYVFAPAKTNLRQRVGFFTTENGLFFEQNGTDLYMVRRSKGTGAVVDTRVARADWNGDKLDGSGPSGIVMDTSKAQIIQTEYEWLGVGQATVAFVINGKSIVAHSFNNANNIDRVYMTTATLPVRYEIENTGATSGTSTMKQICCSVISNGGYQRKSLPRVVKRDTAATVGTSYYPVCSIRMASGRTDSVILPLDFSLLPVGNANSIFDIAVLRNGTISTGSWVTHPDTSNVEYNISATGITGGEVVRQDWAAGSNQSRVTVSVNSQDNFELSLGRSIAGVSDTLTLCCRVIAGTDTVYGSYSFYDLT